MNRLTDDRTAEGIKHICDGLIAAGAEPTMSDRRYVKLAEYESTGFTPEAFNVGLEAGREEERKKYVEAMRTMSAKITELEDKHWEECRQIALYDDEVKQLKKEIAEKYVKREEMWAETCGYKE